MFTDPINPSEAELHAWAYTPGAVEPVRDFDLILESDARDELYLEFAADTDCPQRRYFLSLLYLIVGNAVRSEFQSRDALALEDFVKRVAVTRDPLLQLFVARSRALMAAPETFSYSAWCGGELAADVTV
jgi:hypothetical protein